MVVFVMAQYDAELDEKLTDRQIDSFFSTKISDDEADEIIRKCDGIIIRSPYILSDELVEKAINLKFVIRAGSGIDNISELLINNNILFSNVPRNSHAVAELVIAILFSIYRKLPYAYNSLKKHEWCKEKCMGREIKGKTIGILGFGRIGREVAELAYSLGMKILINDRSSQKKEKQTMIFKVKAVRTTLEELLMFSDVIVLALPLNSETRNLIDYNMFSMMKRDAVFINVGRGELVVMEDLLRFLKENSDFSAGIDVFDKEPPIIDFDKFPNLFATPHIGAQTGECRDLICNEVINLIDCYIENRTFEK